MFEITPLFFALLLGTGLVAGVINTLAGGGSNLTLPALMILGLPADVANATNRVGVLMQSLVGTRAFDRHGKLERGDAVPILVPTLLGSVIGALCASYLPTTYLKPILLGTMLTMALIILIRPAVVTPMPGEMPRHVGKNPGAWWTLFVAGIYGGFVQAGVGFVLLAALAGGLRYDLVRANALKMFCTAILTILALGIFVWRDQVLWIPGLTLAVGTMAGAQLGVRFALKVSQKTLKWFLFLMTLFASAAALLF
ncbi:sulfite exporter TauE/SafE family protein [Gilvimarinus sp. F26214L]|uniref:sulfite exporter TauE/SafE family protein n=1 Tax=Gilvimarinus sp. DZF01 TaxID=3461371 RepID=UPI004045D9AC